MEDVSQQHDKSVAIAHCGQCLNFREKRCCLGYHVNAKSKPCSQGVLRQRQRP